MDLPGVQDLLGALQQAGNLLYQLLMVPKYRITGTHVHCCIFSRVRRYFIVLGLVREGMFRQQPVGFLQEFLGQRPVQILQKIFISLEMIQDFKCLQQGLAFGDHAQPFFFQGAGLVH